MAEDLILRDAEDVKRLLHADAESLVEEDVKELNYWLRNYVGASFNELALEVMATEGISESGFLHLARLVLSNRDDLKLDVCSALSRLLQLAPSMLEPKYIAEDILPTLVKSLMDYPREEAAGNVCRAIDLLVDFLSNLRRKKPEYASALVSLIHPDLFVPLARLVQGSSEETVKRFAATYERLEHVLLAITPTGPLRERYERERRLVKLSRKRTQKYGWVGYRHL